LVKLTDEQAKLLFQEEALYESEDENAEKIYEVVKEGKWEDEGKYSHSEYIFKDLKTNKHYRLGVTRCGSYFSHYDYDFDLNCPEVELQEVVIKKKEWVEVKKEM